MQTRRRVLAGATCAAGGLLAGRKAAAAGEYWPGPSSWETAEPAMVGLDPTRLSAAVATALADRSSSVLVLRGGRIVAEQYASGLGARRAQEVASVGKSIISVLVGVALDQGMLRSVNQPAADFIPQWRETPKAAITLRHMLTMTSGLDTRGMPIRGAVDQFHRNASAPLAHPPGSRWVYDTPTFHLLFHILERAAGQPFETFAKRVLLDPLGMADTTWVTNTGPGSDGPAKNYYTARCSARDLARFGLCALRGGRWDARRIVSAEYLRDATTPSQDLNPAYGYLWWQNARPGFAAGGDRETPANRFPGSPRDTYAAMGQGGQAVFVAPSLDLVVIRQGQTPAGSGALPRLMAGVAAAVQAPKGPLL